MKYETEYYDTITQLISKSLSVEKNFDIIERKILIGGRQAKLYFIDGFIKDELMQKLLQFFGDITEDEMPSTSQEMLDTFLPYIEVDQIYEECDILKQILSGVPSLFIAGYENGIAIDCRTYPARGVEEPEKDKVLRGSRDGFVETIVFNTALIRRRIRDPKLRMEMYNVGTSSRTDVVLCYMEDRVDRKLLQKLRSKIERLKVGSLSLNQESLAECLQESTWLNPFPNFKYCERPDATAASVLEGQIAVLVDNSPAVMLLPTSIFDIMEEANDYYFPPVTGTYIRISRFLINLVTWILTPTFLLLAMNPQWVPEAFQFILVKDVQNIPLFWQFMILELAIDGLRLASINTPSMLSTPLSVVAGLVIGEFTVSSGWFNSESMLYMAFVAIANYAQTSFEMGYAIKFQRLMLLILTASFNIWGYIAGILLSIVMVAFNKTLAGRNYLYPLIPWDGRQLVRRLFRVSLPWTEKTNKR